MKQIKKPRIGWLSREGKFYPCLLCKHDSKSIEIEERLKLPNSLEKLGWIRCHDHENIWSFAANTYNGKQYMRPTQMQIKWLIENGYCVDKYLDEY